MIYIGLQFFGGRGSGGGKGGGGGRAGGNGKGSASNPVKSSEMDKMSFAEKRSALDNMPIGTQVRTVNSYYNSSSTFVKTADGWDRRYTGEKVSRGRLVKTTEYRSADFEDILGKDDVLSRREFYSIRYPKKG